uniref:hypothetical protein n=1 Tax=Enterococcus faecium TaxID=1352 RepID=UPI0034E96CA5
PSPTPVATPTADEPAASTVPACDQLFPIEQVRAMFDDDRIEARGEAIARDPALLPGPVAQATYAGATTTRTCGWAIPYSDGGFFITVVRADEAEVRE